MFFKQLKEIMSDKVNLTFTVHKRGEELTIAIFQNSDDEDALEKVKPLSITGIAEEIDKEFFDIITKPVMRTATLLSNVKEVTDSIDEAEKEEVAPEPKKKEEKVKAEKPSSIKARAKELAQKADGHKALSENAEALKLTREALVIDPQCKLALKLLDYLEKWEKQAKAVGMLEEKQKPTETSKTDEIISDTIEADKLFPKEPVTDQNSATQELIDIDDNGEPVLPEQDTTGEKAETIVEPVAEAEDEF